MSLCVCIPSYNSINRMRLVIKSWREHMYGTGLAILAQDYSEKDKEEINSIKYGANIIFINKYPDPFSLVLARDDLMEYVRDYKYVMHADDDFEFRKGSYERYEMGLDYLDSHENCGGIGFQGYMQGHTEKFKDNFVINFGKYSIGTHRGIIYRNPKKRFLHPDFKRMGITDGEDLIPFIHCITNGMYYCLQRNCPTLHRQFKNVNGEVSKLTIEGGLTKYYDELGIKRYDYKPEEAYKLLNLIVEPMLGFELTNYRKFDMRNRMHCLYKMKSLEKFGYCEEVNEI